MGRALLVLAVGIYAFWIAYGSLVCGPAGLQLVGNASGTGWGDVLGVGVVRPGRESGWLANFFLLIPFGFLLMAATRFQRVQPRVSAITSFLLCLLFILAVKYAQLYFPSRTAALNNIPAQAFGAAVGIILLQLCLTRLIPFIEKNFKDGEGLTLILGGYTIWLLLYLLMPFDVVTSFGDISQRVGQLPEMLLALPGGGRGVVFRVLLIFGDTLALVPVGMFLAVRDRSQTTTYHFVRGFALVLAIELLTLFDLGASIYAATLIYRTVGIWLGLIFMQRIRGKDLRAWHYALSRFAPAALGLYAVVLVFVSGLMTRDWLTLDQAIQSMESRQLPTLWDIYVVSKAHAIQTVVVHLLLYIPVGAMIWMRRGFWLKGANFSAMVALLLSLVMEIGRGMKPGLRPDFAAPFIAAVAAAIAFKTIPIVWRMLEREAMMNIPPAQGAMEWQPVRAITRFSEAVLAAGRRAPLDPKITRLAGDRIRVTPGTKYSKSRPSG